MKGQGMGGFSGDWVLELITGWSTFSAQMVGLIFTFQVAAILPALSLTAA